MITGRQVSSLSSRSGRLAGLFRDMIAKEMKLNAIFFLSLVSLQCQQYFVFVNKKHTFPDSFVPSLDVGFLGEFLRIALLCKCFRYFSLQEQLCLL